MGDFFVTVISSLRHRLEFSPGNVAPIPSPPDAGTPPSAGSSVGPGKADLQGPWMAAQARTWKNLEAHHCQTPPRQDPSLPSRVRLSERSGPIRGALGGSGLTNATCATRQLRLRMTPFLSFCERGQQGGRDMGPELGTTRQGWTGQKYGCSVPTIVDKISVFRQISR